MRYAEATAHVGYYRLKRYQVRAQVDKVKSHFIQSARENIAERYDLHRFESAAERLEFIDSLLADNKYLFPIAECLEFIDSLLADNKYLFPIAEHVEDGVRGPNPMQRESKAANEWLGSTLLPGGSNPAVYIHQILSSGE
jgi:hypothetical protein